MEILDPWTFNINLAKSTIENPERLAHVLRLNEQAKTEMEIVIMKNPELLEIHWIPTIGNIKNQMNRLKQRFVTQRKDAKIDSIIANEMIEQIETGITSEEQTEIAAANNTAWTIENTHDKIALAAAYFDRHPALIRARPPQREVFDMKMADYEHKLAKELLEQELKIQAENQQFWLDYLIKKYEVMQKNAQSNLNFGGLF